MTLINKKVRELRISTLKQMLQLLPIAIAQVKAANTSLYQTKEITKKVYKDIMNPIKL